MKESKKRDPLKGVIAFTILFAILAAGAFYGETRIKAMKDEQLTAMQSEVEARNQQAQSQYQAALSEFEQQTTSGANLAWPQQSMTGWDVVDLTSYPLENVTTTTLSRQEAMYEGMLLVNEWHSRPDDFLEDNLVSVSKATERKVSVKDNTVRLFPQAVEALQSAIEDAGKEGLENYVAWEGYRSWDEQNTMFQA